VPDSILQILRTFTDDQERSIADLAGHSNVPAAQRWANRLVHWRLLDRTDDGGYRAGLPLRLSSRGPAPASSGAASTGPATTNPASIDPAATFVAELAVLTSGPVRLGVLHPHGVAHVQHLAGKHGWLTAARSEPAETVAIGHALLAFAQVSGAAGETRQLRSTGEELALAVTRMSGVAITRRRKRRKGFRVAVPVLATDGTAIAAIEVAVRSLHDDFPPILAALVSTSRRMAEDG
jgi:DNA-binding IclR family transcriptional regulator